MTQAPEPGWYSDPELEGRLRYWDGAAWTEHLAAPQPTAPFAPPPQPPAAFPRYGAPQPHHVTLFTNPYEKPARTKRRALEDALSTGERVRAAAIDAALIVPFVVLGLGFGPLLGWIAGNSASAHHAYRVGGIVLAVILGLGVIVWNFLIRDITYGTDVVVDLKKQAP